jgi:polyhydroxyalkanoate synthesis regulator phasin
MTFFDVLRNALLAGFGVQEKVKEFIDELVKKGELSESQGAKLVMEWSEKADKSSELFSTTLSDIIAKTMEKMPLATKDDLDKLQQTLNALSVRLNHLESLKRETTKEG